MFRKALKAVGDHKDPSNTAFRYDVIEFNDNGSFKKTIVHGSKTNMRMEDPTHTQYEVFVGGGNSDEKSNWKMILEQDFQALKKDWDDERKSKGYNQVDENGNVVAPSQLEQTVGTWILDLVHKNG